MSANHIIYLPITKYKYTQHKENFTNPTIKRQMTNVVPQYQNIQFFLKKASQSGHRTSHELFKGRERKEGRLHRE